MSARAGHGAAQRKGGQTPPYPPSEVYQGGKRCLVINGNVVQRHSINGIGNARNNQKSKT